MKKLACAFVIAGAAMAASFARAEDAAALAGEWRGSYSCAQGRTGLVLTIGPAEGLGFTGEFYFYPLDRNPGVPDGRFAIEGSWEPASRRVEIRGVAWIEQPTNYALVDLSGTLSADGRVIDGTVDHPSCMAFRVQLEGKDAPANGRQRQGG